MIQISSDGTPQGTKVYVDGVELKGVIGVSWKIGLGEVGKALIEVSNVGVLVTVPDDEISDQKEEKWTDAELTMEDTYQLLKGKYFAELAKQNAKKKLPKVKKKPVVPPLFPTLPSFPSEEDNPPF